MKNTSFGITLIASLFLVLFSCKTENKKIITVTSDYKTEKYYCTPCKAPCDAIAHDKEGMCEFCNMPIVKLTKEELKKSLENSQIPKPLDLKYNEWEELGSSPYRASRLWIKDYKRKHVQIESDGILLSGALYYPHIPDGKKLPAMIIAHGSGPTTQYNLGYYTYLGLKMGFAVLVCDKRGVGNSQGEYNPFVSQLDKVLRQLARDLVAQNKWLKTQKEIDTTKIGMMGPSQAGWIMPLAATMDTSFEFMIPLSGPAVSVGEENYYSALTNENYEPKGIPIKEADKKIEEFNGDPIYDPKPVLEKLTIKTLWVYGTHDRSVPVGESLRRLKKMNRKNYEYKIVQNAGHGSANVFTGVYIDFVPFLQEWLVKTKILE